MINRVESLQSRKARYCKYFLTVEEKDNFDNIRMDIQEVGCGYMDWIGLAQDRDGLQTLVSAVINLRVP